ncbi:MAG TPA: VCBS repeat-containing protein, partial [Gemmataceae bacterium]|nr:VCBS repeat-containing protein [Gemmataceae bacterium]
MRSHLAPKVRPLFLSWQNLMRRWNAVSRLFSLRSARSHRSFERLELRELEKREAPSDTLSVLLGQLAAPSADLYPSLGESAQWNVPAITGIPSLQQDATLDLSVLPPANQPAPAPQPLPDWLRPDFNLGNNLLPSDGIALDPDGLTAMGSMGSGLFHGMQGSASFGNEAGGESASGSQISSGAAFFAATFGGTANNASGDTGISPLPQSPSVPNSPTPTSNTGSPTVNPLASGPTTVLSNPAPDLGSAPPPAQNSPNNNLDGGGGSGGGGGGSHPQETPIFVVAPDAGAVPLVQVYNANLTLQYTFDPFPGLYQGGVRVAVGDLTGSGHEDIIVGAGPGGGSQVKIFDASNGSFLFSFNAFDAGYTNGVYVATGDLNGDGKAEIIVGTDAGSTAPMVKVFNGTNGHFEFSVMADDANMHGGVRVAAGDVKGTGHADIITADGPGGPPRVGVFDGVTHKQFYNFFVADPSYRGGIYVAAADVEGTGNVDIVTGTGTGSNVQVFRGSDDAMIDSFQAFDSSFNGGARVTTAALNGTSVSQIVVGEGPGGGLVRAFDARSGQVVNSLQPYGPLFNNGLFVAGVPAPPTAPVDPTPVVTVTASDPATSDASGAVPAEFTFTRTGDTSVSLAASYALSGTGVQNTDYSVSGGPVWAAGQSTATMTVTAINDYKLENDATVVCTLLPHGGAYALGTPSQATILVMDTDTPKPRLLTTVPGSEVHEDLDVAGQSGVPKCPRPTLAEAVAGATAIAGVGDALETD